jgi:DNA-binding transcriptional regulator PaaX
MRLFRKSATQERTAWSHVMDVDPLHPQAVLPKDYPGVKAWQARSKLMTQAGKQIRSFQSPK